MRLLPPLVVVAAVVGGCGATSGGDGVRPAPPLVATPGGDLVAPASVPRDGTQAPDPRAVRVIRRWLRAVREGDNRAAARLWAVPATFQNASPVRRLKTRAAIRAVNASLPCGAVPTSFAGAGAFTIVRFALVPRHGVPGCYWTRGAHTRGAIVVRDGHIQAWYRLYDEGERRPGPEPVNPGAHRA